MSRVASAPNELPNDWAQQEDQRLSDPDPDDGEFLLTYGLLEPPSEEGSA